MELTIERGTFTGLYSYEIALLVMGAILFVVGIWALIRAISKGGSVLGTLPIFCFRTDGASSQSGRLLGIGHLGARNVGDDQADHAEAGRQRIRATKRFRGEEAGSACSETGPGNKMSAQKKLTKKVSIEPVWLGHSNRNGPLCGAVCLL